MEGCRRRELRAVQRDVVLAWRTANFTRAKDLKNLDKYLDEMKPQDVRPADQAAAIFEGFAARGLAKIRERKRVSDGG